MRVVDEHDRLAVVNALKATRDRGAARQSGLDRGPIDAEDPRRCRRGQRVIDLKVAGQSEPQRVFSLRVLHPKPRASELDLLGRRKQVRRRLSTARVGDDRAPRGHRSLDESWGLGIARVQHPRPLEVLRPEQLGLGRGVLVHVAVEVQMILAQVGVDGGGEAQRADPAKRDAVRGDLERDDLDTGFEHARQRALQVDGLGGREGRGLLEARAPDTDRSDVSDPAARALQDRLDHVYRARLAVRTGDADQGHGRCRSVEEARGYLRQCGSGVVDVGGGQLGRESRDDLLRKERRGPLLCGPRGVAMPVGRCASQRDEQGAGCHLARVGADLGNRRIARAVDAGPQAPNELFERLHSAPSTGTASCSTAKLATSRKTGAATAPPV